ncbi:D-TA family PLP-dependent enzyme [Bacillus sp. EB106-08-02-XG196]|jgi:D-serine deaminase-like pyridoxal phosphate-dependent protein|uniref:D-TA family PLP-dependent enzyme n=1 Tax=Bacillus sp. EB106-08-02-XG196 TaxID=2737049 RepID=UPI0015C4159A|nr:D-TA family PLP-dependent enzyme [Bacillus sp. EB106-08-02-XG196]NWQ41442.1 D-TA family PLP-dependent enzyme [Bacillus sp. EB106-08-02-XG196]
MTNFQTLDSPTLLLDHQKLLKNISDIANFANEQGVSYRPHIKTHKSVKIAQLQVAAGAVGITTAKISEAEVMAAGGIKDILIAYPISSPDKINSLIKLLQKGVQLKVSVDNPESLCYLQRGLEHTPFTLEVWIKVNAGLNRCGVEPGKDAVLLAKAIMLHSKLKLGGIFTHAGHSYAAKTYEEIENIGLQEGLAVVESAKECEQAGIPIPVRSVGSTPTFKIAGKVPGVTEIRPGNAAFFDAIQVGLGVTNIENCAVTLLASVVGVYKDRIIFDTGSKSLCLDKGAHGNQTVSGFGQIIGHPEVTIDRLSEEHGVGVFKEETNLRLNDKVQIIPNHACPVVNQFEEYVVHENGQVIDVWKVDARGMVK